MCEVRKGAYRERRSVASEEGRAETKEECDEVRK